MRFRLWHVLVLAAVAAGVFVGVARALDFNEEDPMPPHAEVGMVYSYEIGTHAGCLPHRLVIDSGNLPPGLSLRAIDLDTFVVEGIATEAGTFSAWIQLLDCDNKSAETLFTFDVWARRWGIATAGLKPAAVGSSYSAVLEGAGTISVNGSDLAVPHTGAHALLEHERHTAGGLVLEPGPGVVCHATCFTPGLAG